MKITCTIILLLVFSSFLIAQSEFDKKEFSTILNEKENKTKPFSFNKKSKNEIDFVFSNLFWCYKSFFSSQDINKCNFTPSCSEYALASIRKKGVFKGALQTFDRLSRCNGLAPEQYAIDPHTHLLIDKP
jgi:uncharacterized protein